MKQIFGVKLAGYFTLSKRWIAGNHKSEPAVYGLQAKIKSSANRPPGRVPTRTVRSAISAKPPLSRRLAADPTVSRIFRFLNPSGVLEMSALDQKPTSKHHQPMSVIILEP